MTTEQLTEIEARLRAATPGPWTWTRTTGRQASREFLLGQFEGSDGPDLNGTGVGAPGKTVEESCLSTAITGNGPTSEANAIFIANAPTDIAALIAEVAELRKLHPIDAYHEDFGNVLWWKVPIQEPPYCGTPLDSDFPNDYYTHWSKLPEVNE